MHPGVEPYPGFSGLSLVSPQVSPGVPGVCPRATLESLRLVSPQVSLVVPDAAAPFAS